MAVSIKFKGREKSKEGKELKRVEVEAVKVKVKSDNVNIDIDATLFVNENDTLFIPFNKQEHEIVGTLFLGKVNGLYQDLTD